MELGIDGYNSRQIKVASGCASQNWGKGLWVGKRKKLRRYELSIGTHSYKDSNQHTSYSQSQLRALLRDYANDVRYSCQSLSVNVEYTDWGTMVPLMHFLQDVEESVDILLLKHHTTTYSFWRLRLNQIKFFLQSLMAWKDASFHLNERLRHSQFITRQPLKLLLRQQYVLPQLLL
jgi:hypothetical protein